MGAGRRVGAGSTGAQAHVSAAGDREVSEWLCLFVSWIRRCICVRALRSDVLNHTTPHPPSARPAAASLGATPDDASALPCTDSTRRFQETVGIINGVDVAKFPAVLTRLIKKLHTKVTARFVNVSFAQRLIPGSVL